MPWKGGWRRSTSRSASACACAPVIRRSALALAAASGRSDLCARVALGAPAPGADPFWDEALRVALARAVESGSAAALGGLLDHFELPEPSDALARAAARGHAACLAMLLPRCSKAARFGASRQALAAGRLSMFELLAGSDPGEPIEFVEWGGRDLLSVVALSGSLECVEFVLASRPSWLAGWAASRAAFALCARSARAESHVRVMSLVAPLCPQEGVGEALVEAAKNGRDDLARILAPRAGKELFAHPMLGDPTLGREALREACMLAGSSYRDEEAREGGSRVALAVLNVCPEPAYLDVLVGLCSMERSRPEAALRLCALLPRVERPSRRRRRRLATALAWAVARESDALCAALLGLGADPAAKAWWFWGASSSPTASRSPLRPSRARAGSEPRRA